MEESVDTVENPPTTKQSKKRSSSTNEKNKKKNVKRCRKKSSNENEKLKNSIPIFTDEFLDLFRKQKSEIRSLKLNYSQLSERFKFKDAQQEQIRLDNQKMRLDIEEISQKNYFLKNQIEQIQKQFKEHFQQDFHFNFFKQHINDQDYQNKINKIVKNLQL
jgi:ATP-dependent Lon protease